jgi:hypothetical protein
MNPYHELIEEISLEVILNLFLLRQIQREEVGVPTPYQKLMEPRLWLHVY